jgi:sugar phosphate permease
MTRYRWVVMAVIFVMYTINFADRANIGVVLPMIKGEFRISNFEAGALASFFFLGYAITQIPAGFWYSKHGTRGLVTASILGFAGFTYLIGTATSAAVLKWFRLGLGLTEAPCPVGAASTINNWFPRREKATATGIYIASTQLAPVIVPPLCVWIMVQHGWRYVFYYFAIPSVLIAGVWYLLVRNRPQESRFCSASEVAYINNAATKESAALREDRSLGWIDRVIRAKKLLPIQTNGELFKSWNIWANTVAYFFAVSVVYGLMTWIPMYLVNAKHYSFIKMGWVAATPWLGGVTGSIIGGWISDKIFLKRRKPLMLVTTLTTAIMMVVLINVPADVSILGTCLFMTGFLLNLGYAGFTAYPMGLTTGTTFPVAISVVNTGGNLGGFFSPMIAGALLDAFSYTAVFGFFGLCAILAFIVVLTLDEPL